MLLLSSAGRGVGVGYVRVAVVQLDYVSAALLDRGSFLEDPLFDFAVRDDTFRDVPGAARDRRDALRRRVRRVRRAYEDQLTVKLEAILAALRAWDVRVVLFPEYAVPWGACAPLERTDTHRPRRVTPDRRRTALRGRTDRRRAPGPAARRTLRRAGLCDATGSWIDDPPLFDWIRR
jgi:hypothetical protein